MTMPTTESTANAVGPVLQEMGGFLRCRECGGRADLGTVSVRLQRGWPKCHGYTMEWVTQRQIDEGYLEDPDAWNAKERARRNV